MAGIGVPIILLLFSALGFWTLWGFPARNNLLHFLGELTEPGASIPGPNYAPMRQEYTGFTHLDKQLTVLVGFFYTAIDGNRIDISLTFLNLGSQVVAAWILISTEAYRIGNKNTPIITYITILGILIAVLGYAFITPIYLALHLLLSPLPTNPHPYNLSLTHPIRLTLLPLSTTIGFGIPSLLMTLPAPKTLTYQTKQSLTALQQFWPLTIYISQKVLEALVSIVTPMLSIRTEQQKRDETVKYMRRAYLFALLSSAAGHLIYTSLGLTAWLAPSMLSPKLRHQLQPDTFLVPINPFADVKAGTLADGALWFLQWDLIVGTLATMVWGIAVRLSMSGKVGSLGAWWRAGVKYIGIAAVVGPVGSAVVAVWGRDEIVFSGRGEDGEEKEEQSVLGWVG